MKSGETRAMEHDALVQLICLCQTGGGAVGHIRTAMREELTDRQRELIEMYYLRGMNMPEIARELALSPSTVSRTLKRGRERIRKCLKYNGRMLANALQE